MRKLIFLLLAQHRSIVKGKLGKRRVNDAKRNEMCGKYRKKKYNKKTSIKKKRERKKERKKLKCRHKNEINYKFYCIIQF